MSSEARKIYEEGMKEVKKEAKKEAIRERSIEVAKECYVQSAILLKKWLLALVLLK